MTLVPTSEAPDLAALHPADAVEALNAMAPEKAGALLSEMDFRAAVNILDQAGLEHGAALVEAMHPAKSVPLLTEMAADRRAEIFRQLDREEASTLLTLLPPDARGELEQLLSYDPDTAGSIMTTEFFQRAPANGPSRRVLARHPRDRVGAGNRLCRLCPGCPRRPDPGDLAARLVTADPQAPILSIGSPAASRFW